MSRLHALLAVLTGAALLLVFSTGAAQATPVPTKQIATVDACAVLNAEGVGKLRADVLAELGVPELASDEMVAALARDQLGCDGVSTLSGPGLDATICANLDLEGIRGLLVTTGAPGIAERLNQGMLDRASVRLGCAAKTPAPAPAAPVAPTASPAGPAPAPGQERIENCDQADAAGRSPILFGDASYRPELDIDGDGVACEKQEGATGSNTPRNDQVTVMPSGGVGTGDGTTAR